jgi:hypothetical protein
MIFQNPKSKYPICGIPDNILDVLYHSTTSGFMTSEVFALSWDEWLADYADMYGCQIYIYMENYAGHNTFLEAEVTLLHLNARVVCASITSESLSDKAHVRPIREYSNIFKYIQVIPLYATLISSLKHHGNTWNPYALNVLAIV